MLGVKIESAAILPRTLLIINTHLQPGQQRAHRGGAMLHDSLPHAERGGAHDGLLGFYAPARWGDDEGDFALQAWESWCREQPSSNLMDELGASAPINIGSADRSCDSYMTVASSALSSNATLAAAASSDVGDHASYCGLEVDSGGGSTLVHPHRTYSSYTRGGAMLHDSLPHAQRGGAHDGLLGFCAPHPARGGDDEGDFVLQAWWRAQPSSNLMDELGPASAPVNIGSADGSCDSYMTVASALSSNATLAASSDVGDDASYCGLEVDSGGGSTLFKDSDEPSGVAGARPRPHAGAAVHQRSFKELGFAPSDSSVKARSSSAIQKTRAKKAPAPESRSSGVPANFVPSFLPLGMMAAALSKDLAERKLLAEHKIKIGQRSRRRQEPQGAGCDP